MDLRKTAIGKTRASPEAQASGSATSSESQLIDFRRYLRTLDERKWTVIVFVLVTIGGATAWTLKQTKIYRATATVQVDLRAPSVLGREVEQVEELGTGSYWNNQEYLRTQYKIIQSREVTSRVVRALGLTEDPSFAGEGEKVRDEIQIAQLLGNKIIVEPVRDARLIRISVEDSDPERAKALTNAVADAYLAQNLDRMLDSTVSALNWLSRQLEEVETDLQESERALYDFRQERDILSISLEERQNITANQMQKLSEAHTVARTTRIEIGSKITEMRKLAKQDPLEISAPVLIDNALVQQLKRRHAELDEERAGLAKEHGKNWPRVREIDGETERIRARIGREVESVLNSVEAEYRAAKRTEIGIKAALNEVQRDALKLNLHEIEYNGLVRQAKTNAKMYDLVLGRTKETDLARLLNVNNLRVLDYAVLPTIAVKPRTTLNLLIALMFGLLGGIALAILLDSLDVTVKAQDDLERMGITFLGLLPSIDEAMERKRAKQAKKKGNIAAAAFNQDLVVHERPKSSVAESCRSIRTNLLFMSPEKPLHNLLVTSPGPREGKTTVAISLATVMAQGGSRTVLVDLDMRRPRTHRVFDVTREPGISSAIVGETGIDEIVRTTVVDNLFMIPSGPVPPNPSELLHTERFAQLLCQLGERFDRVVLDSPPLGAVTDAAILGTQVDGVVLVAKSGATRREALQHARNQLVEIGANVLGTVLNDVSLVRRGYNYYSYYYYRRRGYYAYGEDIDQGPINAPPPACADDDNRPTATGP